MILQSPAHSLFPISNQDFWNLVKLLLSNKGGLIGDEISLVHENQIVTDDYELTEIFNKHYINIVQKTSDQNLVKSQTQLKLMIEN